MPKLTINGQDVEVESGMSVLQACETIGIEIPRFCYHDKLSVPANCRMCLVEQEGAPKPVPSCALPVIDGMVIKTNTDLVHKARKGVMEFLLINHPLDCPICDQGGECDLQDQAMAYGFDRSRFQENKRAVKDKDLGPLVKTVMTRCIHCTRCIRFGEQIGGMTELGLLGRGEETEVGTFVEAFTTSELSGNMIDICPVGALTSKPYAFKARPWELRKTETIDVLDGVGSNIRVDTRSNAEVMRVVPCLNEAINEEWISDKTRFAYDGLKNNRLDRPYVRNEEGQLEVCDWDDALSAVTEVIRGHESEVAVLTGDMVDCETITALKDITDALGIHHRDGRFDGADYDISQRSGYIMNTSIEGLEEADAILLVGTNPRHEATLVNARIRKCFYERQTPIGLIGAAVDLTYNYDHLGDNVKALEDLAKGKGAFAKVLKDAEKPALIISASLFKRKDAKALQALTYEVAKKYDAIAKDWNGYNVIQSNAAITGALDLGFIPAHGGKATNDILKMAKSGKLRALWLIGVDHHELIKKDLGDTVVIYQGHHGDRGASVADIILPTAAYTEKNATYVNTEGRPQRTRQAMFPLGQAKEGWTVIRALSDRLECTLPYDNLYQVHQRMVEINPIFEHINRVSPQSLAKIGKSGPCQTTKFPNPTENYYKTCVITRASHVMSQCTAAFVQGAEDYKQVAE